MAAEIIKATKCHAKAMAPYMREADVQEVWASHHMRPREALVCSLRDSRQAWTALIDGEPIAMWGVACQSMLSDIGIPWLLATDQVREVKIQFIRSVGDYIQKMLGQFTKLENYVDARNKDTVRWLKWWGFNVYDPEPYGAENLPFHRIFLRKEKWD